MEKIIVFFVIVFFISVPNVSSEPSKTINYLMNEPVSMLDLGLHKLRIEMEKIKDLPKEDHKFFINDKVKQDIPKMKSRYSQVYYDWNQNNIILRIILMPKALNKINVNVKKNICIAYTKFIKETFNSGFKTFFMHDGYTNKKNIDDFAEIIDSLVVITIRVNAQYGAKGNYGAIVSRSRFVKDEIYFNKIDYNN